MSDRLNLAVENGHVVLPQGHILVLNGSSPADLAVFNRGQSSVWARTASAQSLIDADGWASELTGEGIAGAVVFLPRARDEQRAGLRRARDITAGPIVVDGNKSDGVESLFRELRKRAEVSDPWSKSHGKVFTVAGGDFNDWPDLEPYQAGDGWWRAPGAFSADGEDKASVLLVAHLPDELSGSIVDLGAGWGFLSSAILKRPGLSAVHLVEDHFLSLKAAARNVTDPRAQFHAADALTWQPPERVDHVVTNPPFHTGRKADPRLGQAFIQAAARMLKPKGSLWLVANRHLPYEGTLQDAFKTVDLISETPSFKIFHATSPKRRKA